jgi:hypothetical protein
MIEDTVKFIGIVISAVAICFVIFQLPAWVQSRPCKILSGG